MMREEWVLLIEAESDLEADIINGLMAEHGIPVRKEDSSPYTGAMRVIGGMAYQIRIMVPKPVYDQALSILRSLEDDQ